MKLALAIVVIGGVLLAIYAMVEIPHTSLQILPEAEYYPLAVGDTWIYKMEPRPHTYTCQILGSRDIDGVRTYAMSINNTYSYVAARPDGIYQFGSGDPDNPQQATILSPPELMFRLPLKFGAEWEVRVLEEPTTMSNQTTFKSGRVIGVETVKVPAGMFSRCAKVLIEDPREAPADRWIDWLAPGVGIVKTETFIDTGGNKPKITTTELLSSHLQ